MLDKYKKYESYCREGAHESIIVNNNHNLTREQHLAVLKRIAKTIESGTNISKIDSDAIGDKELACNWGMCSDSAEHYPTAELHTFPKDFDERGRTSALDRAKGYDCPMRNRSPSDSQSERDSGCYYQCRIFQRKHETPTRIEALDLYHTVIKRIEDSGTK